MSATKAMPYAFQWSTAFPHIAWADLHNNLVSHEIAVVSVDASNGDLYYIPLASLDEVDKQRMYSLVTKRDAAKYGLWDLMSGTTLKNGVNALEYFNQLVSVRTPSGQIYKPQSGKAGVIMLQRQNAKPLPTITQTQAAPMGSVDFATANSQVTEANKAKPKAPPAPKS